MKKMSGSNLDLLIVAMYFERVTYVSYVMPASHSSQGKTGVSFTLHDPCTLSIVWDSRNTDVTF